MKSYKKTFVLLGYLIQVVIAKPRTVWWINDWHPDRRDMRLREDHLISLIRCYSRGQRAYIYELHIGRLKIIIARLKQF